MKIVTKDTSFDGKKEMIAVVLTESDKQLISAMHSECTVYAKAPVDALDDVFKAFVEKAKKKGASA